MGRTQEKIEIELRSLFDEIKYRELEAFLAKNGRDLGKDDKDVYFFLLPDRIAKVVNSVSKSSAKIVMKLNRLGSGRSDFEEIEIPINPEDFEKAIRLFSSLNFDQIEKSFQKRHNFSYKGVEIALKYSDSWGYHAELELVVDDVSKQNEAKKRIEEIAKELSIRIMSEEEITEFARKIDKNYRKGLNDKKKCN